MAYVPSVAMSEILIDNAIDEHNSLNNLALNNYIASLVKGKGVPLHAMEAHGGRGGIAAAHT
jgi:hypothetical protein